MNGHGCGEAWGLDIANDGHIITSGDDNKIINFDPVKNVTVGVGIVNKKAGKKYRIGGASTLSLYPPNQCSRAVAINHKNGHVAIATNEGEVSVREGKDSLDAEIKRPDLGRGRNAWIEAMSYSPDGKYLAVGTHDRVIYILDVENGYSVHGRCTKHNSAILNIDWATDS